MRRIVVLVFVLGACSLPPAWTQAPTAGPPPELKRLDLWVGDWTLAGTAKDAATEPEYKLDWKMQGRRVLGGRFVQISHTWIGKGVELTALEILSYDPVRRIHTCSGFQSDGTTWIMTATFSPGTSIETGTDTYPDGKKATWRNT